ncbi:MAG: hypothetical protein QOK47_695 [Actinomycetota bacterium]|nr:hypothetical protein [Actinomycetota bacterium]
MSKKLEEKQRRRAAEEQRRNELARAHRRQNLVTLGIVLLVGALVVFLVLKDRKDTGPSENVGAAASEANCSEVETNEVASRDHVDAGTDIQYDTSPPVGGDHWPPEAIADTGFYTSPIDEERLVHNQEHGQVVIWYSPDAPQGVQDDLEKITEQEPVATATVPYDDIKAPYNFAMTAWQAGEGDNDAGTGVTQFCELVSQKVVDDFRRAYQGKGPEPITPPFRG